MRSQQDLAQILAIGGGLDLKAGMRSQEDLTQLAAIAGRKGATLILRELGKRSTVDLAQIAALGKGNILFILED
jgi:hypothetical protein